MGRQGRMHSSPFHVESATYKYAIEHENAGYSTPPSSVECAYKKRNQSCSLWNSGFEKCAFHKCHYKQVAMRKNSARCQLCAYCFGGKCVHPRKPPQEKPDVIAAEYCRFYISKEDNADKYHQVRSYETRVHLTSLLDRKRRSISTWKRYIRQVEGIMAQLSPQDDDYLYFADKIALRRFLIDQAENVIVRIQADLAELGGELREVPRKKK